MAFKNGDNYYDMSSSGSGTTLYEALCGSTQPPTREISEWLLNMDGQFDKFIEQIKPSTPDPQPYTRREVLQRDDFLDLLVMFPAATDCGLSRHDMRTLVAASDIWMALAGTLAYSIGLATGHVPKKQRKKKRTGGPDVWQLVYLGIAEVFVSGDTNLLAAASAVSKLLKNPRCVVPPQDFLAGVTASSSSSCPVCHCVLPTVSGSHFNS
jgi:hypothetical protein